MTTVPDENFLYVFKGGPQAVRPAGSLGPGMRPLRADPSRTTGPLLVWSQSSPTKLGDLRLACAAWD
ncbi:hypothetical protein GCM10027589_05410 [Actinocorallia lasiicapitis]